MFIPLHKVDAAQRLVFGRLDETPDRVGEVFDYASSRPEIERWSKDMEKASGGKSLGNVRVMHQLKAAGVLTGLHFDDKTRSVEFCAHIVDDDEWQKIESGVYTGFSPGGRKRFLDATRTRYTAFPSEISLVDLPCIPSATFTLIKADGAVAARGFARREPGEAELMEGLAAAGSRREYRALLLAMPADRLAKLFEGGPGALPLAKRDWSDSERKAAAASGVARPDGSYPIATEADVADAVHAWQRCRGTEDARSHIVARARAIGAAKALPPEWGGEPDDHAELAALAGEFRRAGGGETAQAIHDLVCRHGARCSAETSGLAKIAGDLAATREDLAKAVADRAVLSARIAALERTPSRSGPLLYPVERGGASDPTADAVARAEALPGETQAQQLAKATALTRLALVTPNPASRGNTP
jgi:hypothetical protein